MMVEICTQSTLLDPQVRMNIKSHPHTKHSQRVVENQKQNKTLAMATKNVTVFFSF